MAKATGIPQSRLSEILAGRRAITADTAARLGRYFGVDSRNWLNLQSAYDLWLVELRWTPNVRQRGRVG